MEMGIKCVAMGGRFHGHTLNLDLVWKRWAGGRAGWMKSVTA